MFGRLGLPELVIILVIIILIFGANRLPGRYFWVAAKPRTLSYLPCENIPSSATLSGST